MRALLILLLTCGLAMAQPASSPCSLQGASCANQPAPVASSFVPLTGATVTIPPNQVFSAITPAGTLAALTVALPVTFPQGGDTQFTITQIITALTVSAPAGFTIVGTAVSGATTTANTTWTYRLLGTVWYRTQ